MMNRQEGTEFRLDNFSVTFPLNVQAGGALLVQDGDTLMRARSLDASLNIMPLFVGRVDLKDATLSDARYKMGNLDSATCIVIQADKINLDPAQMRLGSMAIALSNAQMHGGVVDIFINPIDTTPKANTPPSPLTITARKIEMFDFTFRMNMMPIIDSLGVFMPYAMVEGTQVDVMKQIVNVKKFRSKGLQATYLVPDSAQIAQTQVLTLPVDSNALTPPWTIDLKDIDITGASALYTTRGLKPMPGFDPSYIQADSLNLQIKDFHNAGPDLNMPLRLQGRERCGLDLRISGTLNINPTLMTFSDFVLKTPMLTRLDAQGRLGVGDVTSDPQLPVGLDLTGKIAASDVATLFPMATPYVAGLNPGTLIDIAALLKGTMGHLDIENLMVDVPSSVRLVAKGQVDNVMEPDKMGADIAFNGRLGNLTPWRRLLAQLQGIKIPALSFDGDFKMAKGNYQGRVNVTSGGGRMGASGRLSGYGNDYQASLNLKNFPLQTFLPAYGVATTTASLTANGHLLNPAMPGATAQVKAQIQSTSYNGHALSDIVLDASLQQGQYTIDLTSANPELNFAFNAQGSLDEHMYTTQARLDAVNINPYALGITTEPLALAGKFELQAQVDAQHPTFFTASLTSPQLAYTDSLGTIEAQNIKLTVLTNSDVTNAQLRNGDLYAFLSMPMPLDSLMGHLDNVGAILQQQKHDRCINIEQLQQALPQFNLDINGAGNNIVSSLLAQSDMSLRHFNIEAANDSIITLEARALGFESGTTRLDTITFNVHQHGNQLNYDAGVGNRPGTMDQWARVSLNGYFRPGQLGMDFTQQNIKGKTGFKLGAVLDLNPDSTVTLHFTPYNPIISYQNWAVNTDNFIKYRFTDRHVDANLRLHNAKSSLAIFTQHVPAQGNEHQDQEDLVLQLSDIKLQDFITLNPFAPPVKGNLNANVRLNYVPGTLSAQGNVKLADLFYGNERVGDFDTDLNVSTRNDGAVLAKVGLNVNGTRALTLEGVVNDSTKAEPLMLDLEMIHFPLSTANPFMPGVAQLTGSLDGKMKIDGTPEAPNINGTLAFNQATVKVDMLGTVFKIASDTIPIQHNVVRLDRLPIQGLNENPLYINGSVDIHTLDNIGLNLSLAANNMQVVSSNRAEKGADVYGRAFLSVAATAKGSLRFLDINGQLTVNSGTNVTYVMASAETTLQQQAPTDMVKFVNFNDTTAVQRADSLQLEGTLMNINALLTFQSNVTVGVDLSANGKDRAQLQPLGTLQYVQQPAGEGRVTGRLSLGPGYVRYTPPLMSEKDFHFDQNSYVAFSGNMLNPTLNIHATDQIRANVTQAGANSRVIMFDVLLAVTGTLEHMNVVFDLSTDDDVTIANELQSMSPSQRASQAMNLMLYNVYTGPGTKANANLAGNPLYSFLTSQLNNWMANTIKGVDVSFGVDQYDQYNDGASSTATQYSYRVSKSLFNDRVKIIVGGSYSDDAQQNQSVASNLFNDISIEYIINKSGTMYLRLFRHTGYESILEGEITQTGVGFVYRRKIRRISDMFRLRRRSNKNRQQL